MNRRNFLKGTAGVLAAVGLGRVLVRAEPTESKPTAGMIGAASVATVHTAGLVAVPPDQVLLPPFIWDTTVPGYAITVILNGGDIAAALHKLDYTKQRLVMNEDRTIALLPGVKISPARPPLAPSVEWS